MRDLYKRTFQQGEHICALYDAPDQQLAVAVSYVVEGLRCRERCLYVAQTPADLDQLRVALGDAGVDPDTAEADGALLLLTSDEAHLEHGAFDAERMLRLLNDAVEAALNAGFTGLRTCGDMSWLLGDPPGASQVVEYEAVLNSFFQNVRGLGMCQYDRKQLPAGLLDHAIATHGSIAADGRCTANPSYRPPSVGATGLAQPTDIDWKIRELQRRVGALIEPARP